MTYRRDRTTVLANHAHSFALSIEVRHLAPTPLGHTVRCEARDVRIAGQELWFPLLARDPSSASPPVSIKCVSSSKTVSPPACVRSPLRECKLDFWLPRVTRTRPPAGRAKCKAPLLILSSAWPCFSRHTRHDAPQSLLGAFVSRHRLPVTAPAVILGILHDFGPDRVPIDVGRHRCQRPAGPFNHHALLYLGQGQR